MSPNWPRQDYLRFLITLFLMGTLLQFISIVLIYVHALSKVLSRTAIPQPELIATFLYLLAAGAIVQLFGAYSIYNDGFLSADSLRSRHPELPRDK